MHAFLIVVLITLTSSLGSSQPESTPNYALLYVVRPDIYASSLNQFEVFVNGKHIADVQVNSFFVIEVPPGNVEIIAKTKPSPFNIGLGLLLMEDAKLELTVKENQVYFIQIYFIHGRQR